MGKVSLWVEPSTDVPRGTNVTLRCSAPVSSLEQVALTREYTIYRGSSTIYSKTSISSDDLLYPLPHARFSNSGKYQCSIRILDMLKTSEAKKLAVRGGWRFTPAHLKVSATLTRPFRPRSLTSTLVWARCRPVHAGAGRGQRRGQRRRGGNSLVFCPW